MPAGIEPTTPTSSDKSEVLVDKTPTASNEKDKLDAKGSAKGSGEDVVPDNEKGTIDSKKGQICYHRQ